MIQNERQILSNVPLLHHLKADHQNRVIDAGRMIDLVKGEVLFHEGHDASAIFALVRGQMKLVRYTPRGKEMLLHLVQPGQTFAEAALFGERTYPATAEALKKSRLWSLPRRELLNMIRADPDIGLALVASTAQWTRRLAGKLELLTQRRVEERVAIYLLGRAGRDRLEAGDEIALTEAKNIIASQCGTAPEVLSRTFRRLEDDGILRAAGSKIEVLDPERLYELAELIE